MAEIPALLLQQLVTGRRRHHLPSQIRPLAHALAQQLLGVLFPHFAIAVVCAEEAVNEDLIGLAQALARIERSISVLHEEMPHQLVDRFLAQLPAIHRLLEEDAQAIFDGDPAAKSADEVILTYPGFMALCMYRLAHALHQIGLPLLPRLLTEFAHERTGIDIHPGAQIGHRFCIDHGTGIVVGETSVIGNDVKLYQGVTLGALTVDKSLANQKRHPTIEDGVVVYASATILGGSTVVGHHSVIAGNAFITQSVPSNSIVTRKSEVRARASVTDEIDWSI